MLLDARTLRTTVRPTVQHGFGWSPDGGYFALSTGREVTIFATVRSEPVCVLPLRTATLAWR